MPCKISAPYLAQQREKANTGCLCYSHNLPQSATAWQCLAGVPGKCFKINSISVNCLEQLSGPMLAPVLSVPLTQVWLDSVARLLACSAYSSCVYQVCLPLSLCVRVCVCVCHIVVVAAAAAATAAILLRQDKQSTSCWLNIKKSTLDTARVIQRAFCYATICATAPPTHPHPHPHPPPLLAIPSPSLRLFKQQLSQVFRICPVVVIAANLQKTLQHKHKVII